ncbi:MAG TPA: ABC-2 family transporter protein [Elusimicrobiales bacterium]|nr:ABC-2 family transporter protein [Elusimicrobiales bacterium]
MLQKFLSGLKLRAAFARVGFTQNQVYSISTYLNILAAFLFVSVQYYLWSAIFEHAVHGQYSLSDMLQYVLAAEVLSVCLHSNADRQLGQMVRTGSLAHVMLKPVAFTEQIFFESLGVNAYRLLFICVPLVLCSIFAFGVEYHFGPARLAGFLALAGLAYIFIYLFELLLGLISFFSVNTWGINSLKMAVITVFSGRFLPISAYPENFRALVDELPFKIMYFEPLNFLIKGGDWAGMFIRQCGWIAAAFLVVFYLQRALLKKMVIQGG